MQPRKRFSSPVDPRSVDANDLTGGFVAHGFEPVAHAFQAAILSGEALGAACTIIHRGETVVDLHGGRKDHSRKVLWSSDDIALVYSLSKGLTGMAAAVAVSRGMFTYDEPVADIWPEFAAHGKGAVTVGGSLAFCDPEDGVAYAWITTQLGTAKWDDAREKLVRDAFYPCL